jgi:AcrR family transcriptional regulator
VSAKKKIVKPRGVQKRGDERRHKLIDAAEELLSSKPLSDLQYVEIANHAGLPMGSCYHFYKTKNDLVRAMVAARASRFIAYVYEANPDYSHAETWPEIFCALTDRVASYFEEYPAIVEAIMGHATPPEISHDAKKRDMDYGDKFLKVISAYFVVPNTERMRRSMYIAVEIADCIMGISYREHGKITKDAVEDANLAAVSFLLNYLPEKAPAR